MITTKQKPRVNTQNIKRRDSKRTAMENHQFTEEDRKRKKGNMGTTRDPENN